MKKELKLCRQFFLDISKKTGDKANLYILTLFEETVFLVYHVLGLISINGLEETLKYEITDDPQYRKTIAAYKRIGSKKTANILKKGVILIHSKKNNTTDDKKINILFDQLEGDFFLEENNTIKNLYMFIKNNFYPKET